MLEENTVKNTVRAARNGGSLKTGNPGNRGGGRRPDHLRALARETLGRGLALLDERLADPALSTSELLKAVDLLMRYGIGPAMPECTGERPVPPLHEQLEMLHGAA